MKRISIKLKIYLQNLRQNDISKNLQKYYKTHNCSIEESQTIFQIVQKLNYSLLTSIPVTCSIFLHLCTFGYQQQVLIGSCGIHKL